MYSLKSAVWLLFISRSNAVYNTEKCCKQAKLEGAFLSPVPENQICGQSYSTSVPAAANLYIDYAFCSENCGGMGPSNISLPSEWAAPIVQFILPSVIFSMTIPRRMKIDYDTLFEFTWPANLTRWSSLNNFVQLLLSLLCFLVILIPVFIDTIIWIVLIVVGAGNMLIGALYEAHLDYRIVKYIKSLNEEGEDSLNVKRDLLVTIASGNLLLGNEKSSDRSPKQRIFDSLTIPGINPSANSEESSRSRLLSLLGAQSNFGGAVGSPVLFYLGAFVYTILDLRHDPSNEYNAMSLGFEIEWMIIVHVAIVSGYLLASNNPSTSAGIVGADHTAMRRSRDGPNRAPTMPRDGTIGGGGTIARFAHKYLGWSKTYDTEFEPVSLWSRGVNKMEWIKQTHAWEDPLFRDVTRITRPGWIFKIFLPAVLLIAIPPAAGGVVAYFTPPRGIGCRSLSFIIYAACQLVVTGIALVRNAVHGRKSGFLNWVSTDWRFKVISSPFWFGSLLAAIGGTAMQISGVYSN